jgi:hypothetical protein
VLLGNFALGLLELSPDRLIKARGGLSSVAPSFLIAFNGSTSARVTNIK